MELVKREWHRGIGVERPEARRSIQYKNEWPGREVEKPAAGHPTPADTPKPKLLDRVRLATRTRHYSRRTEQTYVDWVKRFVLFHGKLHPAETGEPEINAFLTHLAVKEHVSASTQNQALSALLFLYRHVLGRELGDFGEVIRAGKPTRLPVVMTREEVKAVLTRLQGTSGSLHHSCMAPVCGSWNVSSCAFRTLTSLATKFSSVTAKVPKTA